MVSEIRESFKTYSDVTADSLAPLPFLNDVIMEQLRVAVVGATGASRVSPGASVDGNYIPKGVSQTKSPHCLTATGN